MFLTPIINFFDPYSLIDAFGNWALLGVCLILIIETGFLIGVLLPGDTLLIITGVLVFSGAIKQNIIIVALALALAAFIGAQIGYEIGRFLGPKIFERKDSGFFSKNNVYKAQGFFNKYGSFAVIAARFVPVMRTFIPISAGVAKMPRATYTLYNAIGATIWASGLSFLGWAIAHIPWLKNIILHNIELIIISVIVLTILGMVIHYFREKVRNKKLLNESGENA